MDKTRQVTLRLPAELMEQVVKVQREEEQLAVALRRLVRRGLEWELRAAKKTTVVPSEASIPNRPLPAAVWGADRETLDRLRTEHAPAPVIADLTSVKDCTHKVGKRSALEQNEMGDTVCGECGQTWEAGEL